MFYALLTNRLLTLALAQHPASHLAHQGRACHHQGRQVPDPELGPVPVSSSVKCFPALFSCTTPRPRAAAESLYASVIVQQSFILDTAEVGDIALRNLPQLLPAHLFDLAHVGNLSRRHATGGRRRGISTCAVAPPARSARSTGAVPLGQLRSCARSPRAASAAPHGACGRLSSPAVSPHASPTPAP